MDKSKEEIITKACDMMQKALKGSGVNLDNFIFSTNGTVIFLWETMNGEKDQNVNLRLYSLGNYDGFCKVGFTPNVTRWFNNLSNEMGIATLKLSVFVAEDLLKGDKSKVIKVAKYCFDNRYILDESFSKPIK